MRRPTSPLLMTSRSRFAALPWQPARVALGLVALLVLVCLLALRTPDPTSAGPSGASVSGITDVELYGSIVEGVRHGGNYYATAAEALRADGFPLRPFVTFRLPTLAVIEAALPAWAVAVLLYALAAAVLAAWARRLMPVLARPPAQVAALLLLAGGSVALWQAGLVLFHEVWAGLLIALSLALRRPGRWLEAVALALAAVLIRETAALYVAVMAGFAWIEGERREALAWGGVLAILAVALGFHAHAVAQVLRPLDPVSPGWNGLLGPGFFARTMAISTALSLLPLVIAAPLVGFALVGWAAWADSFADRALATLAAYAVLLSTLARLDTFYWGLLVAPILLVGLVFAPDGLRDLVAAALDRRRITVRRVNP